MHAYEHPIHLTILVSRTIIVLLLSYQFTHAFINSTKEVVLAVLDHYYSKDSPLLVLVIFCRGLQKMPHKLNSKKDEYPILSLVILVLNGIKDPKISRIPK